MTEQIQKNKTKNLRNLFDAIEFETEFKKLKAEERIKGIGFEFPKFKEADRSVDFEDFTFKYGDGPHVLQNVTIQIPKNKVTAIIGPSGCGKSTLLRSINRMNEEYGETSHTGKLLVNGRDINQSNYNIYALRALVGMVFQKPQPFPRSIYDNITFGPKLHGIKSKEQLDDLVDKSLKDVGLYEEVADRLNDHAFGLSGGQQQRLCIARSIAVNPSIILFDEPASALDPRSTFQIEDLLLELKKDYTVVIVTHNMQQAARISDYCIFMYNGNVVEYNKTEIMFEKPHYTLTENYISGRFG